MTEPTEKITIRVPKKFIDMLDFLVQVNDFPSRSEAIRSAIRDMVYERVDLVIEKMQRMQEAEKALAEMQNLREQYFQK